MSIQDCVSFIVQIMLSVFSQGSNQLAGERIAASAPVGKEHIILLMHEKDPSPGPSELSSSPYILEMCSMCCGPYESSILSMPHTASQQTRFNCSPWAKGRLKLLFHWYLRFFSRVVQILNGQHDSNSLGEYQETGTQLNWIEMSHKIICIQKNIRHRTKKKV